MKQFDIFDSSCQEHVIGLGFFDCMHLGHRHLLHTVQEYSEQYNAIATLSTFRNNFADTLGRQNRLIYTYDERVSIMEKCGVKCVVSAHFDRAFSLLTARDFFALLQHFNPKALVCGYDYTFGCDRATAKDLEQFCAEVGIDCSIVGEYEYCGTTVSSTAIKHLLNLSDITKANTLLGEDYFLTGTVVRGRGEGHKLGFPTANLSVDNIKLLPQGVFCGYTDINGIQYNAIVSVGTRPTYNLTEQTVEAHILNLSQDLYGKTLTVILTEYMRPNRKFDNTEQLRKQIDEDKRYAESKIWPKR